MTKKEVTVAALIKEYNEAGSDGRAMLIRLHGKEVFEQKITDRIKTFEDACAFTNTDPDQSKFKEGDPDDIAYQKLKVIVLALNEGWKPNWDNSNERKWRAWFWMETSGFRFFVAAYVDAASGVGSRLCFKSEELCIYAAKQFLDLYKDFLTK